jgi:hypothetical protein
VGHCNCHIRLFWRCQATCATNTVAPGGTRRRGFWTLRPSIGPGVFARDSAQRQPSSWPSIRMEVAMVQEIGNGVPMDIEISSCFTGLSHCPDFVSKC